jgi:hypothetical protein
MSKRGAKSVSDRDWLFGSRPRRLALEALLRDDPKRAWTKADLARAAGVSPKGGIDEHLAGFERIGLVVPRDRGYGLADPPPAFMPSLRQLLAQLAPLSDHRTS